MHDNQVEGLTREHQVRGLVDRGERVAAVAVADLVEKHICAGTFKKWVGKGKSRA